MNDRAPLVSIITPAYNAAPFLRETYDSLRAQTISDWEWLVANDGSTDDTMEGLRELAREDPRVRPLDHPPRKNPAIKRNEALRESRGKFIAFLDADDLWMPDKLAIQLETLDKIEKPGLCYSPAETLHMPGTEHLAGWPDIPLPSTREQQYELQLLTFNWASPSSVILSREFFEQIGYLSELPLMSKNDFQDFILISLTHRPLIRIPKPLIRYRISPGSDCRAPDAVRSWRRYLEVRRLADARGEISPSLRRRMYAMTWTTRAIEELREGDPTWRVAFLKAFCLEPWKPRRWPNLLALVLPRRAMLFTQNELRGMVGRLRGRLRHAS